MNDRIVKLEEGNCYNINYDMLATHDHGVEIDEVLSNAMKGDSLDLKIEEKMELDSYGGSGGNGKGRIRIISDCLWNTYD